MSLAKRAKYCSGLATLACRVIFRSCNGCLPSIFVAFLYRLQGLFRHCDVTLLNQLLAHRVSRFGRCKSSRMFYILVWELGVILSSLSLPGKARSSVALRCSRYRLTDRPPVTNRSINQFTLRWMMERYVVPADFPFCCC